MKEVAPGYYEFTEEIRRLLAKKNVTVLRETIMEKPLENFGEETVFLLSPPDDFNAVENLDINHEYINRAANAKIDLVLWVVPKDLIDPLL